MTDKSDGETVRNFRKRRCSTMRVIQLGLFLQLIVMWVGTDLIPVSRGDEKKDPFQVSILSVSSGRKYELGRATLGGYAYIDRKYEFYKLPDRLVGQRIVRTSMDDDYVTAVEHLKLDLSHPARLYIGIDQRGKVPPSWLQHWRKSPEKVEVGDIHYEFYEKRTSPGVVTLGGNERNTTGACSNYLLVIVPEATVEPFLPSDFANRIRPLLETRCYSCHGPEVQDGGLRLDIRRRALAGGDSGLTIDPFECSSSELIARITSSDDAKRMPLGGQKLTSEEVDLLTHWIDAGAIWPDELAGREEPSDHWSFRPISRPVVPSIDDDNWSRNPIDVLVLSKLKEAGLHPSPEASRQTLYRRLSLDLLGLPPSPEELKSFVEDPRSDAYEQLVERLLQSSHFGERWGKHWLDMARFAESDGYENDRPRPHAWRYRDWVIQAVNEDLPYDQFTISQLAGDLLPEAGVSDRIATSFHRNTLHNSAGGADAEEFRSKAVKDRTAVTAAIWMGLTWNCAECHTHKYDPVTHREYYQLYAFFNNAEHSTEDEVPTLKEANRTTQVHRRGNFLDPGQAVKPGVPSFLPSMATRGAVADRLDLARWLMSAEHPLTARVFANHVWQHLFGRGLVTTPENFGRKGELPTHPELLDWLAAEIGGLHSSGSAPDSKGAYVVPWSRKSLIRLIVYSSTYRQSSTQPETPPSADPENRLLWRQNRFRVEAEIVRDLALAASGLLDPQVGGASIQPPLPRGLSELSELKNERFQESSGSPYRRGIYIHMQRTFPYPMLATFDGTDGNQCLMLRDRSTTPMQALTLLNEPALEECAQALAERLSNLSHDDHLKVQAGFLWCLSRSASQEESQVLHELVTTQRRLNASEEAVWHGVARTLLNLDEMITRE